MLTVGCTFLRGVYDAAEDGRWPEWPPSWFRLYCALVSVADGPEDDAVLRALEEADPPLYVVPREHRGSTRVTYVPTNRPKPGGAYQGLPGRIGIERSFASTAPAGDAIWFHWPSVDVDPKAVDRLCRRVGYLGRSTSPVALVATASEPPRDERLVTIGPVGEGALVEVRSRVPVAGTLDQLRDIHHRKMVLGEPADPWATAAAAGYRLERHPSPATSIIRSPYERMIVFRIEDRYLDGRHTARLSRYLRAALMARAPEHVAVLHGHHDGSRIHAAVVGLPFVGHRHADGHLVGMSLLLPGLELAEGTAVHEALPEPGDTMDLTAGPFGVVRLRRLSPLDAEGGPLTTRPSRWRGPTRTWATALPMVLDRHVKRGRPVEPEIVRSVVNSGLPAPTVLRFDRRPLIAGGLDLAPRDTVRRRTDRGFRPYRHALLRFPEPVEGPLVVGSMRHYGLGLLVPVDEEST